MRKNMNSEVSLDIIELILSKLPFSNLPTCRQVCKAWNNVLLCAQFTSTSNHFLAHFSADSNFNCVHFDDKYSQGFGIVASLTFHPTFSLSKLKILGSCNGLLFCEPPLSTSGKFILNPMTNEYLQLPETRKKKEKINGVKSYYGFGLSTKTSQYKVVRCSIGKSATKVKIFAFGKATTTPPEWTRVAILPFCLDRHGTYFNGALYWPLIQAQLIYRFDFLDEKFEEIPFPLIETSNQIPYPLIEKLDLKFLGLQVFDGSFYLTITQPEHCLVHIFLYRVWKMNRDHGSWIEVFSVLIPQHVPKDFDLIGHYFYNYIDLRLVEAYEDGKVLCLQVGLNLILFETPTMKQFVYYP